MHDLEHDFAVSNVELEGGDRGMKIVVQIVLQIVQILCSLNTNFLAVSLKDSHPWQEIPGWPQIFKWKKRESMVQFLEGC